MGRDGRLVPNVPPPARVEEDAEARLRRENEAWGIDIGPWTATARLGRNASFSPGNDQSCVYRSPLSPIQATDETPTSSWTVPQIRSASKRNGTA